MQDVLHKHILKEMVGLPTALDIPKNQLNVRRKHVFTDGINKISRPDFVPSHPVSVKFADELGKSEGAVDLGGPALEFFRLALSQMFSGNAFSGPADSKVLVLNQEGKFYLCL